MRAASAATPIRIANTAFEAAPDRGRGLARDMTVRGALEDAERAFAAPLKMFDRNAATG